MMKAIVLGAALALATAPVLAGDAAKGKEKSATCAGCHGADGNSTIPTNPILAGQYENYLLHALEGYKSGARKNPIMQGMVAALSEDDLANLAAYFASQETKLKPKIENK